jgi:hypothetical protein
MEELPIRGLDGEIVTEKIESIIEEFDLEYETKERGIVAVGNIAIKIDGCAVGVYDLSTKDLMYSGELDRVEAFLRGYFTRAH